MDAELVELLAELSEDTVKPYVGKLPFAEGVARIGNLVADNEDAIADLETITYAIPELTRYVDPNAPAGGDGSLLKPYNLIQDAIDEIETWAPNYYGVYILGSIQLINAGGASIDENLVATQDNLFLIINGNDATMQPSSGEALIVSNASEASIATWKTTHTYSDLQPKATPGPGPASVQFLGFYGVTAPANAHAICALGVKGDDTADTTAFGSLYVDAKALSARSGYSTIYARNAQLVNIIRGVHGADVNILQCAYCLIWPSVVIDGELVTAYDTLDAEGCTKYSYIYTLLRNGVTVADKVTFGKGLTSIRVDAAHFRGEVEFNDDAEISRFKGCYIDGDLDINGTGALPMEDVCVNGDVDIVAAGNLDAKGCRFLGDFTAAAGAGVVDIHDSVMAGAVTDTSFKIIKSMESAYTRYVDNQAPAGGIGTKDRPYTTIQAAIDDLEANVAWSASHDVWGVVMIRACGYNDAYDETVKITKQDACIRLQGWGGITSIWPSSGDAIIVSNASDSSLVTWESSRTYSDLAPKSTPESGPYALELADIELLAFGGGNCMSLLGVAGDDTASTTEFLGGGVYAPRYIRCSSSANSIYARNVNGTLQFREVILNAPFEALQSSLVTLTGLVYSNATISYDAADPEGHNEAGANAATVSQCDVLGDLTVNDAVGLNLRDSFIRGDVAHNGTGSCECRSTQINGDVDIAAGVDFDAKGCRFLGDFTAAAGAGVVTLADSPVLGSVTDAGDKITHTRAGVRAGTVTAAGAGDEAIVFGSTLGTTQYVITITQEDDGTGQTTYMVKSGTKAATGFTMTVGGAGIFHWKAEVLTA